VKIAAGSSQLGPEQDILPEEIHVEEEIIIEEGEEDLGGEEDLAVEEEAVASASAELEDDGRGLHDDLLIKSLRGTAVQMMREVDVESTREEEQMAWQIFPRVCGFSILVCHS
jgi:hypothetical protein